MGLHAVVSRLRAYCLARLPSTREFLYSQKPIGSPPEQALLRIAFYAIAAFSAAGASAATLYSQTTPDEPIGAFSSQDMTSGQIIADNFSLSSASTVNVRSIRVIGAATGTSISQSTDIFRVVFFEDSNGLPGDTVEGGNFSEGVLSTRIPTEGQRLNGRNVPIEYSIDLADGVLLNPSTVYWISIMNDPEPRDGWLWARANGTFDSQIATVRSTSGEFTGLPWVEGASSGGMWFELSDQNVPEPSSLLLITTSLAMIQLLRRL